jgi:hypothetical protein
MRFPPILVHVCRSRALCIMAVACLLSGLLYPATAPAQTTQEATKGQPDAAELQSWRKMLLALPRPRNGCFTANYPERQWREVACSTPPHKLYPPKLGGTTRLNILGAGVDFSAMASSLISTAEGSFDSVAGVTSEGPVSRSERRTDVSPRECGLHLWHTQQQLFSAT